MPTHALLEHGVQVADMQVFPFKLVDFRHSPRAAPLRADVNWASQLFKIPKSNSRLQSAP